MHLDGTVKGLLPKLIRSGFDAIEALTPKPGGDLDVEEIRNLADGSSAILWGGVPGIMFSPPYTWQQMESHVRRLIDCWRGRPFILGVADQVPPDGDIQFCRRIAEMIREAYRHRPRLSPFAPRTLFAERKATIYAISSASQQRSVNGCREA